MNTAKRATIYLETKLHKALKLKAVETDSCISDLVNKAVAVFLNEDAEDLEIFDKRKNEPSIDFDTFVRQLKKNGDL